MRSRTRSDLRRLAAALAGCALLGCGEQPPADPAPSLRASASARAWSEMIASEEVIHDLQPMRRALARSLRNLRLPDRRSRGLFGVAVEVTDLAPAGPGEGVPLAAGVRAHTLPAGAPAPAVAPMDLDLWRPLFDQLALLERASFGVRSGRFVGGSRQHFAMELALSAVGRRSDGALVSIRGPVALRLARLGGEAGAWRIDGLETGDLELQTVSRPLFREVLDEALPDAGTRRRARRSIHEELVVAALLEPSRFEAPHPHFFQGSQDRHPGIVATDVDRDGNDDLYVMARWGPNQLFLGRGDGTFEERAAALGLDLRDHATAAIFADFDNDGDADAFVGRSLLPSVYLENEGGRFEPRSDALQGGPAPGLVSSVAAADVNGDGLLDLYVSTYAAQMLVAELQRARRAQQTLDAPPPTGLLADHLSPAEASRLLALTRSEDAHPFLALPGPPNVLLLNTGDGHFRRGDPDGPLSAFRNTYQSSFADYDSDGDPDVYLAHDFAPNQLLRNEGGGRFRDVTEETGTADLGFGMGASWGDYDGDGRQDLYVSNMYSKAGKRITGYFEALDPRFRKMARGNTLFRNLGDRFEQVSGLEPPDLQVERAGWSWGGQFGDLDNDGNLDLYVLNGYYSAPREAHVDVDI